MDTTWFGLLAVVALVLGNGFFVATEFAIVAVRKSRLEQLAAEGHESAKAAQKVVAHLDTFIAACQLGITMASLALGWIGEPALSHLLEPPLALLIGAYAETASHGLAVGVSFMLITTLHIVIGELAPKGLALQRTEATALAVARPMQVFETIFRLPIRALNAVGNRVLRVFGLQPAQGHDLVHSVEELALLVSGMQQAGVVDAVEARIARRAFQFGEVTIGELMTPRTEVAGVPVGTPPRIAISEALASRHNRLVVYEGSMDNIVGVVYLRDLVAAERAGVTDSRALVRAALIAPATKPADELLEAMRAEGRQLAVVLDEYGGTAGIVTLENLVVALVGRIEEAPIALNSTSDGSLVLDGLTRLDEFEELADIRVDPGRRAEVDTLGGLVMAELGRLPNVGDEVALDGARLRVEALDGRRVAAIRLVRQAA